MTEFEEIIFFLVKKIKAKKRRKKIYNRKNNPQNTAQHPILHTVQLMSSS